MKNSFIFFFISWFLWLLILMFTWCYFVSDIAIVSVFSDLVCLRLYPFLYFLQTHNHFVSTL